MKLNSLVLSALVAFSGTTTWAQNGTFSSISQGTATVGSSTASGSVTVSARIGPGAPTVPANLPDTGITGGLGVGNNIAGMAYDFFNLGMTSGPTSNAFYTITADSFPTALPAFIGYNTIASYQTFNVTFADAN